MLKKGRVPPCNKDLPKRCVTRLFTLPAVSMTHHALADTGRLPEYSLKSSHWRSFKRPTNKSCFLCKKLSQPIASVNTELALFQHFLFYTQIFLCNFTNFVTVQDPRSQKHYQQALPDRREPIGWRGRD